MHIAYPFRFDARGAVTTTAEARHWIDLIEQLLLTRPGERVNRPDFGCGLLGQVWEPLTPELAAVVQHTVMASIQRWLGDHIEPQAVAVTSGDGRLEVFVAFAVRRTGTVHELRWAEERWAT